MKKRPTMAVIRGSRASVIEFYKQFKKMNILYLAGGVRKNYIQDNFSFIGLNYEPASRFDPNQIINIHGSTYNNLSWLYLKDLEKYIKQSDIINLTDLYYFFNYQAVKLAKKYKLPVITVLWKNIPHHMSTWLPPYSRNTRVVIEVTDLFILRNKKALQFTDSLGIPRSKVKVIYKGVNTDKFKPKKEMAHINHKVRILFVGHLHKDKGIKELLEVFQQLYLRYFNIELVLAGDGPLKDQVTDLANAFPIKYHGFVAYDDLPNLYQQADIFCSPSSEWKLGPWVLWAEYFPYTLMEAQASGLPIVTTNVGGVPEAVSRDNFLVEPEDWQQLYWALERLIINPGLRLSLGKKNRQRALNLFDAKKQARKTEEAIIEILDNKY